MKVAEYISNYLAEFNISQVFGMSGANIEDLYSAISKKNRTQIVLAKNEYNASTMAIGSYLATKNIPVVLTTSGPGILNTLPILAEAFTSKIPFVLISGLIPSDQVGHGGFQDTSGQGGTIDILEMLRPCTCLQIKIQSANQVPSALVNAFDAAERIKKPVVILIPKEIFKQTVSDFSISPVSSEKYSIPLSTSLLNPIASLLEPFFATPMKTPPLVILGENLIHLKEKKHLMEFIKKSSAGVVVTANGKSLFDHYNPQFLGLVGIMGHQKVIDYIEKTDHVIFIGENFSVLNRFGIEATIADKHILIVDSDENSSLFRPKGLSCTEKYGDIEQIFASINSLITENNFTHATNNTLIESNQYDYPGIISEIQRVLPRDANVFVDAGNSGAFVVHNLKVRGTGACYVSLGMGGMGNSIGAAIGSSVASKKKSFAFLGDGSFLMYGLEIHTAIENKLPVVFFIFNNNSHGMCSTRENVFMNGETGVNNFKKSHYSDGLSKMFPELVSYEVSNLAELKLSLDAMTSSELTCVISINLSNNEFPPFLSFKKNTEVLK